MKNDKLSHLSQEQVKNLIDRYYGDEKVIDLIKEYNIDVAPGNLVHLFPPIEMEETCPYCTGVKMVSPRPAKSYINGYKPVCPSCGHKGSGRCVCNNCYEAQKKEIEEQDRLREEREKRKISLIQEVLSVKHNEEVPFERLSFKDIVILGAFVREGILEDDNIKPIIQFSSPFAPDLNWREQLIDDLITRKFIIVHSESNIEAINIDDYEEKRISYSPIYVNWRMNVFQEGLSKQEFIDRLILPENLVKDYPTECYELWKEIALYESIEFLKSRIQSVFGISYEIGNKTLITVQELLRNYSISQVMTIINKAVKDSSCFYLEKGVNKRHAVNTVIGNALRYGERAVQYEWNIFNSKRYDECPQSILSRFFFENVLKVGHRGFIVKPAIDKIFE